MIDFCHFHILNHQKNHYTLVMIAKDTSADAQRSKTTKIFKNIHCAMQYNGKSHSPNRLCVSED